MSQPSLTAVRDDQTRLSSQTSSPVTSQPPSPPLQTQTLGVRDAAFARPTALVRPRSAISTGRVPSSLSSPGQPTGLPPRAVKPSPVKRTQRSPMETDETQRGRERSYSATQPLTNDPSTGTTAVAGFVPPVVPLGVTGTRPAVRHKPMPVLTDTADITPPSSTLSSPISRVSLHDPSLNVTSTSIHDLSATRTSSFALSQSLHSSLTSSLSARSSLGSQAGFTPSSSTPHSTLSSRRTSAFTPPHPQLQKQSSPHSSTAPIKGPPISISTSQPSSRTSSLTTTPTDSPRVKASSTAPASPLSSSSSSTHYSSLSSPDAKSTTSKKKRPMGISTAAEPVLPPRSIWFRLDNINRIERREMPEFFATTTGDTSQHSLATVTIDPYPLASPDAEAMSPTYSSRRASLTRVTSAASTSSQLGHTTTTSSSTVTAATASSQQRHNDVAIHTAQQYKDCRDWMVTAYRRDPRRYLAFTTVRRYLHADVGSLYRIYRFLESWEIINNAVDEKTKPSLLPFATMPRIEVIIQDAVPLSSLPPMGPQLSQTPPSQSPSRPQSQSQPQSNAPVMASIPMVNPVPAIVTQSAMTEAPYIPRSAATSASSSAATSRRSSLTSTTSATSTSTTSRSQQQHT